MTSDQATFRNDRSQLLAPAIQLVALAGLCLAVASWFISARTPMGYVAAFFTYIPGFLFGFCGISRFNVDKSFEINLDAERIQWKSFGNVIIEGRFDDVVNLSFFQYPGRKAPSMWLVRFANGKQICFRRTLANRERLVELLEQRTGKTFRPES